MTDTTSSNFQLAQDTYAAFGRGDIDAVIAAMPSGEQFSITGEAGGGHARGLTRTRQPMSVADCSSLT